MDSKAASAAKSKPQENENELGSDLDDDDEEEGADADGLAAIDSGDFVIALYEKVFGCHYYRNASGRLRSTRSGRTCQEQMENPAQGRRHQRRRQGLSLQQIQWVRSHRPQTQRDRLLTLACCRDFTW